METENKPVSTFDYFGGYYSALMEGIEFARFAPSPLWSEIAQTLENRYGKDFSYVWVAY